jgi:hypothetical protein
MEKILFKGANSLEISWSYAVHCRCHCQPTLPDQWKQQLVWQQDLTIHPSMIHPRVNPAFHALKKLMMQNLLEQRLTMLGN